MRTAKLNNLSVVYLIFKMYIKFVIIKFCFQITFNDETQIVLNCSNTGTVTKSNNIYCALYFGGKCIVLYS